MAHDPPIKGILLAGGLGTRLHPLTLHTNKHLLPVGKEPMIAHPIRRLVEAGIDELCLVTNERHIADFAEALGDGSAYGVKALQLAAQPKEAAGIADALAQAEALTDGARVCVMLGDNLIERSIADVAARFAAQPTGARVLLKAVDDPHRFGIARLDGNRIIDILEKPADPPSNLAVVGIYFYDADVFDICRTLQPSSRGELEITDVNRAYCRRGDLQHEMLEGWWCDVGTHESLQLARQGVG